MSNTPNVKQNAFQTDDKTTASQKIGCRFTPAEVKLLDLLSTLSGTTTSDYFRRAIKRQMMDDLLASLGHTSTVKTEAEIKEASEQIQQLIGGIKAD